MADKTEYNRRQRDHWYTVSRRGQLTPNKLESHRDTGVGVPSMTTFGRRPYKSLYTDLFREWGVMDSNRRYDE